MNLNVPFSPQPKGKTRSYKAERERKARKLRDAVWHRDKVGGWKGAESALCARCKVLVMRGDGGEVDHIKPRSTHPELAFDPANARIVCGPCNRFFKTHPLEREA